MSEIREGDRVRFVAGRGYAEGRVANVSDGILSIATRAGKIVRRVAAACEKVKEDVGTGLDAVGNQFENGVNAIIDEEAR